MRNIPVMGFVRAAAKAPVVVGFHFKNACCLAGGSPRIDGPLGAGIATAVVGIDVRLPRAIGEPAMLDWDVRVDRTARNGVLERRMLG